MADNKWKQKKKTGMRGSGDSEYRQVFQATQPYTRPSTLQINYEIILVILPSNLWNRHHLLFPGTDQKTEAQKLNNLFKVKICKYQGQDPIPSLSNSKA